MSIPPLPSYAAVQAELVALALGVDADEIHGSLCGYLAAGGERSAQQWPQRLALDPVDSERLAPGHPLGQLHAASTSAFDDDQFGFRPLLPDDAPLPTRARALIAWCRGFLGGFGLAAGRARSGDAREALQDIGRIAATVPTFDDPEQDAESLEELIEYVRVAVLLLHGESVTDGDAGASSTLH